jgi:hypothetical protein
MKKKKDKTREGVQVPSDVPKEFICELTRKQLIDPVKSIYGNVFEKNSILAWFSNQGRVCPLTGMS